MRNRAEKGVQGVSILNEEVQEGWPRFEEGRREERATQLAGRPPRQRAPWFPEPWAEVHWHSEGNLYISFVARPKHSLLKLLFQFPLILSVFCSWWLFQLWPFFKMPKIRVSSTESFTMNVTWIQSHSWVRSQTREAGKFSQTSLVGKKSKLKESVYGIGKEEK